MRVLSLILAAALVAGCSDDEVAQQAVAPTAPQEAAQPAPDAQQAASAQQPAATQQPATEQAELAAAEAQPNDAADPCDLSGYDMKQMTVELHERLVKACENSKQ